VTSPLIEADGLSKTYGSVQAVRGLSFAVGRGEVVGFLGPNGAGKSTTLRMLAGYLAPSAGQVRVNGHDVMEEPLRARRSFGYMPEAAALYPEMRVLEYLTFRAALKGVPRGKLKAAAERAAEKAGVDAVLGTLIGQLSRGYRQRVGLADALLGDPPLLILDEPTAGLDPNQIRAVRALIAGLGSEHSVLLSTHILSEVESTCRRVLLIDRGRLVAQGPLAELGAGSERQARIGVNDPGARAPDVLAAQGDVRAVRALAALGAQHGRSPAQVYLLTFERGARAEAALEAAVTALVQAGVGVYEAQLERTSLEEVFQRLTAGEAA
jgi:ABC-2 type transport system ATP-binding protein